VGLNPHDRQVLGRIGESLAGSDPHLAGVMSEFSRLADGEAMPGRERIRENWLRFWVILAWLAMAGVLIAITLPASHGSPGTSCAAGTFSACGHHPPAQRPGAPAHGPQG
jgi:hypothetical protein